MIELLSVGKFDKVSGLYVLFDGYICFVVLRELEFVDVFCLVVNDDEGYMYNNRLNWVSMI